MDRVGPLAHSRCRCPERGPGDGGGVAGPGCGRPNRLGFDSNHWHTGFGPTSVELHRASVALELGDLRRVVEQGARIPVGHLPIERQVTHHIDVARACSDLSRDEAAVDLLLLAEQDGPTLVRHSPVVRETVRSLVRRAPASSGRSSPLFALALRSRAALSRCAVARSADRARRPGRSGRRRRHDDTHRFRRAGRTPRLDGRGHGDPDRGGVARRRGRVGSDRAVDRPAGTAPPTAAGPGLAPSAGRVYVVAPATANTVAKLALGIADNQALRAVGEALGDPRATTLRNAGVHLVDGELWPLHEPGAGAPDRLRAPRPRPRRRGHGTIPPTGPARTADALR